MGPTYTCIRPCIKPCKKVIKPYIIHVHSEKVTLLLSLLLLDRLRLAAAMHQQAVSIH